MLYFQVLKHIPNQLNNNNEIFQQTKVLEEKELIGPKKRPIRMGHKLYKELSCVKCQKTFHKR